MQTRSARICSLPTISIQLVGETREIELQHRSRASHLPAAAAAAPVKAAVVVAAPEKSNTLKMMAAKRTSTAPCRLTVKVPKWSLPPAVEAARRNQHFVRGEYVEVRRRLPRIFGDREVVIYVRAKVVSACPGTYSYLVEYPAAGPFPIRTARVAAFDVRAARRFPRPPAESAIGVAEPGSSKRPLPSEQLDRDCCKKAKIGIGKGIPKDVLERLIVEHEKEEEAKKKARPRGDTAPKLLPAPVKAAVATRKVAAPEKSNTVTMMAAKRTTYSGSSRLPATIRKWGAC